ncbi:MAG: phycobilisome rod-core linker polypeptide, partial [Prochloron sp. SP5CPC1]|nr:phycobilisome rod-core linker polypeptide [Candidatus Paraprochloron terpiosi SP5CPC1]
MNFKHLLGRAPISQAELSAHVQTYNGEGYEAEIDSYLCSDEYVSKFGDNVVPYPANISSRVGFPNSSYGRSFELFRGDASCDRDMPTKLLATVAGNLPSAIKAPAVGRGGSYDNTNKRYRIAVSTSAAPATLNKYSNLEYVVNYSQLNQQVRNIHKTGGKIVSITEIV